MKHAMNLLFMGTKLGCSPSNGAESVLSVTCSGDSALEGGTRGSTSAIPSKFIEIIEGLHRSAVRTWSPPRKSSPYLYDVQFKNQF